MQAITQSSHFEAKAGRHEHDNGKQLKQERANNAPPLPVPPAECNLPAADVVDLADQLQQLESEDECKSIFSSNSSDDLNYIGDECDCDDDDGNYNDFGDRDKSENAGQNDD